jgi:hypothetical protein
MFKEDTSGILKYPTSLKVCVGVDPGGFFGITFIGTARRLRSLPPFLNSFNANHGLGNGCNALKTMA